VPPRQTDRQTFWSVSLERDMSGYVWSDESIRRLGVRYGFSVCVVLT